MCARCAEMRRGFLGGLKVTREDRERHPTWKRLFAQDHTRYLEKEQLAQFR